MKSIVKMLTIIGFVSFALAGSSKQDASKSNERQSENVESDEFESEEVSLMRDGLRASMNVETNPYIRIMYVLDIFAGNGKYMTVQENLDWGQKKFKLLMRIQSEEEFHSELDFQKQFICDRVGQYCHALIQGYSEISKQCAKTKKLYERKEDIYLNTLIAFRERFAQEFSEWTMKEQDACMVRLKFPLLLAEINAQTRQNIEDIYQLELQEDSEDDFEEESEKGQDKNEGENMRQLAFENKEIEAMRSALRKCKHIQRPSQRILAVYGTFQKSLGVTKPEGETFPEILDWLLILDLVLSSVQSWSVQSEEEFPSQKSEICDRLRQKHNYLSYDFSQFFKQCAKPGFRPDIRQAMLLNMQAAEFRQDYDESIFEWTVKEQDACWRRFQRPFFLAKAPSFAQGLVERYKREQESK